MSKGQRSRHGHRNSARKRRAPVYIAVERNHRTQTRLGEDAQRCGYCRKRSYPTRAEAKRAVRVLHPGQVGALYVYRCGEGGTGWHIGHPHTPDTDEET